MLAKRWREGFAALVLMSASMCGQATPITSVSDPALLGAALINFDQFTTNTYLNDFTVGNVNFVDDIAFGGNYFSSDAYGGHTGRHIGLYGQAYITFTRTVSAFAFSLMAFNSDWFIDALDVSGATLETVSILGSPCCGPMIFGVENSGIAAVRITSNGSPIDVIVMDDFLSLMEAPEPPALLPMITGLWLLRRIHRSAGRSVCGQQKGTTT